MCALRMFSRWWIITLSENSDKIDQRLFRPWIFSSVQEPAEADLCSPDCTWQTEFLTVFSVLRVLLLAASMVDNIQSLES